MDSGGARGSVRWSSGPGLERDLSYGGSVRVLVPEECVHVGDGFVSVPSRAGVDGFVCVDVEPGDVAACGVPGAWSWEIGRDRTYRAIRTALSRDGKPRADAGGMMVDEACFDGADVLKIYLDAASEPDPEALLAWAFAQSGALASGGAGPDGRPPAGHGAVRAPAGLVLPGKSGCGMAFPDRGAAGGIGLAGGPGASFEDGWLDLGPWCGTVWRLSGSRLVPVPAAAAVPVLERMAGLWGSVEAPVREKFLGALPPALGPWPSLHGRDVVLSGVPADLVLPADLPGTVQVPVGDRSAGTGAGVALADASAVSVRDGTASVLLGRSDGTVLYRRDGGEAAVVPCAELEAVAAAGGPLASGPGGSVRLCGISRAAVREDWGEGACDLEFLDRDGTACGIRLDASRLEDWEDGLLSVDLGGPDSPVRFWRSAPDGIREGVPMTAEGLAELVSARGTAAGGESEENDL